MKTAYENLSNNSLITTLIERDFSILTLQQELAQMKRMIFGAKSERFIPLVPIEQTSLGFEMETAVAPALVKQEISYTRAVSYTHLPCQDVLGRMLTFIAISY